MDKRLLILGVVLIIVGLLFGGSQMPTIQNLSHEASTIAVSSNGFASGQVYANTTSMIWFYYESGSPVDFYMLNVTGYEPFNQVNSSVNTIISAFNSLAFNRGLLYVKQNSDFMNLTSLTYSQNNVSYPAGNYFFVFRNTNNAITNVTYEYITAPAIDFIGQESAYGNAFTDSSVVSAVLFFGGIIVIIISIFVGGRKKQSNIDDEAKKLYASIEKTNVSRPSVKYRRSQRKKVHSRKRTASKR